MKTHVVLSLVIARLAACQHSLRWIHLIPISMALLSPAKSGVRTAGCVEPGGDLFQCGAVAHVCLAMSCWMGRAAAHVSSVWLMSSSLPWDLCCVEDSGLKKTTAWENVAWNEVHLSTSVHSSPDLSSPVLPITFFCPTLVFYILNAFLLAFSSLHSYPPPVVFEWQ